MNKREDKQLITLLSIAASDSSGGAGIQADIRAAALMKVFCMTAVTAVTAQNSSGIKSIFPIEKGGLKMQVDAVLQDVVPNAVKVGLIGSQETAQEIIRSLKTIPPEIPIVVDPILKATCGGWNEKEASEATTIEFYRTLFSERKVIPTPNFEEAKKITGFFTDDPVKLAERFIKDFNLETIIITGHLNKRGRLEDIMMIKRDNKISQLIYEKRIINSKNLHGTGCVFSSLIASCLALGKTLEKTLRETERIMDKIIRKSANYSLGSSSYGPLNLNG